MRRIDADALIESCLNHCRTEFEIKNCCMSNESVIAIIQDAPTVERPIRGLAKMDENGDVIIELLRPQGEWIDHSEDEGYLECPICGCLTNCDGNKEELHYCWHCGADMRGGRE